MEQPLSLKTYPRAIIHIDGDSFFTSCEQSLHPELRGKPIITGKERGIASAVSIEAKKMGIKRGMSIREIKRLVPEIIHIPSDYETYSLFSKRMFAIVRRYTEIVEEYSIDECFAEITGLRRPLNMSYSKIIENIKKDLDMELGMTFSIGLGPSKVVAKIASKWNKPSGITEIPANKLSIFLSKVSIEKVWGIGEQTTNYLNQFGIKTALDFVNKNEEWVKNKMTKPHVEIWNELRGTSILNIETEERTDYQSISKTKTFTPPQSDRNYILSQLSKNLENACIKARRHGLASKKIFFMLRTQDYKHYGMEIKLSQATAVPNEIIHFIDLHLNEIYIPGELYRLTGIVLSDLSSDYIRQNDLFGSSKKFLKSKSIFKQIDELSKKYGKHVVFIGTSHKAMLSKQHKNERSDISSRKKDLFKGENFRQRINIPMLGDVS